MKIISLLSLGLLLGLSSAAHASKARILSLQGAQFLKDSQFMFLNPAQIHHQSNFLTYELGGTTNTASPKAEGGLVKEYKEYDNAKVGVYLGHMDADQTLLRADAGFQDQENPIDFFYGKKNWAANISYSNTEKETTDRSQQRLAAKYGVNEKKYEAFAHIELISKADKAKDTYSSSPLLTLGGEYKYFENIYTYGKFTTGTVLQKIAGTKTATKVNDLELLILDRTIKTKKSKIYFGPGLNYKVAETEGEKETSTTIPFYIGVEYDLKSWMELRASVSQNFVFGSTKDETATSPSDKKDTIANNTTVTVGTGLKYEDLIIDGVFAGSTSGKVDGNTFLANVALTFKF
jgi:hypothetical protein